MKKDPNKDHVCVLKTGKLYDHDIASNALEEKNTPFYKQVETSSGLRLAMPFQPAMGPGTYYKIFVPDKYAEQAKKYWKLFGWFILACSLIAIVANMINDLK